MAEARYKKEFRSTTRARRGYLRSLNLYLTRTTFIFDAEMGRRLAEARVRMDLTQTELGKRLGLSQAGMCRLEAGKTRTIEATAAQFNAALPEYFHYVLFGGFLMPRKHDIFSDDDHLDGKNRRRRNY